MVKYIRKSKNVKQHNSLFNHGSYLWIVIFADISDILNTDFSRIFTDHTDIITR